MNDASGQANIAQTRSARPARDIRMVLLRVAWLSILLGITMQVLLILAQLSNVAELNPLIAEFTQKITWSFIVCMGLAVGTGISDTNPPVMGVAGLLVAPIGFYLARAAHSGVSTLMGSNVTDSQATSLVLVASLRGLEYLCLGLILGWLARKVWGGALAHLAAGLGVGIVFGISQLAISPTPTTSALSLFAWGVNELLFPVGCALILFVSDALGERLPKDA